MQQQVELYGKRFKLIDCDPFTRNFLTKIGVRVAAQNPLRPYERVDTLKQFLNHDRHVLKFSAVWDDRDTKFGEVRHFSLDLFFVKTGLFLQILR